MSSINSFMSEGEWHPRLDPLSMYEVEYETLLLARAGEIFPDYIVVSFKQTVQSDSGSAQADLAFIRPDYSHWRVVEVELGQHSLSGHVLPQVRTLAGARYGAEQAVYLAGKDDSLNVDSLCEMFRGAQPRVLVIANEPRPEWVDPLRRYGADLLTVEIFRSDMNRYAFRLEGDYPVAPSPNTTLARLDPAIPRLLLVDSPAVLGVLANELVQIDHPEGRSRWIRVDSKDQVWLSPEGPNPFGDIKGDILLSQVEPGRLAFDKP